jgi:hypothetical protein
MNFQTLEDVRLFVGSETRKIRIAAQNSQLNGYKEIAMQLFNEAAFGEKILRELANEYGEVDASKRNHEGL